MWFSFLFKRPIFPGLSEILGLFMVKLRPLEYCILLFQLGEYSVVGVSFYRLLVVQKLHHNPMMSLQKKQKWVSVGMNQHFSLRPVVTPK